MLIIKHSTLPENQTMVIVHFYLLNVHF